MNRTSIGWCDFSANPIRFRAPDGRVVWACEKVSAGCQNCYAEALSRRYPQRRAGEWNAATMKTLEPFLDEQELRRMLTYKPASGKRVFVGDMTDIFGEWVEQWQIAQLFGVMALRYDVTWQVLTKRADRMRALLADDGFRQEVDEWITMLSEGDDGCDPLARTTDDLRANAPDVLDGDWPLPNVWLGVSCEDQQRADERIPLLLQTPAAVRFISAEPLIGAIDLSRLDATKAGWRAVNGFPEPTSISAFREWQESPTRALLKNGLDWVIVGGESGPRARPCRTEWVRSIVYQCQESGVATFVKQLGSSVQWGRVGACGFSLDGSVTFVAHGGGGASGWDEIKLHDRKGGFMPEWPEDLRVREFPRSAVTA